MLRKTALEGNENDLSMMSENCARLTSMKTILLSFCTLLVSASAMQAQSDFYKGKQIKIVVGASAGAASDLYARVAASHLPRHIPGKPDIIVQNMPGGGSMTAANYVYTVAKPDGLTLAALTSPIYFAQLLGQKEVQFDWEIGRASGREG